MIEAQLPDGTSLQFPDGTADEVIDRAVQGHIASNKQPAQPPTMLQAGGRGLGLGVRDIIEGAAAVPGMAVDAVTWPVRAAQRALGYNVKAPTTMLSDALTDVGLPEPKTSAEHIISSINRNATSAVVPGGAILKARSIAANAPAAAANPGTVIVKVPPVVPPGPSVANALTTNLPSQAVGGATGGAAGEATRQAGGSPLLQFGASILGGGLGATATQGGLVLGRGVAAGLAPFTQRGREGIVGDIVLGASAEPNSLLGRIRQGADADRLPGSPVTTAQQARDPGLLVMEHGMRQDVLPGHGPSPASRFRDIDARRNQERTNALVRAGDNSDPGARGAVVREALVEAEAPMRARVSQMFDAAEPEGGGAYPIGRIGEVARDVTAKFTPEKMGGGVPVELQAVIDDIKAAPGGTMTFEQIQNVRSRLGEIVGTASKAGNHRLEGAAKAIQRALEDEADSPAWQEAINARRQMGQALERDETGASATGQILKTDRYGAPILPDEQVANRAISSVANLRQTLAATAKAVEDARLAGLPPEQIAALEAHAAATRTALQGQFIANLTKRTTTTGQLTDASGNVANALSPAQFRRFMADNPGVAEQLFDPQQLANLQTLAADFAESSMATATAAARGSPTAQNLSVGSFISRASNGLIDPNNPMAQTVAGLGPVMKWIYAAPEAATREMLTEAMANPKFAEALLAKASPESLQRAMGYVEQTMLGRLKAGAAGAGQRQVVRSATGEANRNETTYYSVIGPDGRPTGAMVSGKPGDPAEKYLQPGESLGQPRPTLTPSMPEPRRNKLRD